MKIAPSLGMGDRLYWLELLGLDFYPELYERFLPLLEKSRKDGLNYEQLAVSLLPEHSEFIRAGKAIEALIEVFDSWSWRPSIQRDWMTFGCLPDSILSEGEHPMPLEPSLNLRSRLAYWADSDHTQDGRGLGIIGTYGGEADLCAAWAIWEMFRKSPFKYPSDRESLTDPPTTRTASHYRAADITTSLSSLEVTSHEPMYPAQKIIDHCRNHEVLFISGLGNVPMLAASSYRFFDLLDYRQLQLRPTIWTSQFKTKDLAGRFSSNMGRLIVQCLCHQAEILNLVDAAS